MDGVNGNGSQNKKKKKTRKRTNEITRSNFGLPLFIAMEKVSRSRVSREANALQRIKNKKCIPSEKLVAAAKGQVQEGTSENGKWNEDEEKMRNRYVQTDRRLIKERMRLESSDLRTGASR